MREALLEGNGPLGRLLALATATEQSAQEATDEALAAARQAFPELNARVIGTSLAEAMRWANNLEREND